MAGRRRPRVRASDLAKPRPLRGLGSLLLITVFLSVVVAYKVGMGDGAVELMEALGLETGGGLPESVLDRSPEGPLDTRLLVRFRDSHHREVMACAPPGVVGQFVLQLEIDEAGVPIAVAAVADDLGDPAVGRCILDLARAWRAPPVHGRKGARLRVPFNFAPRRT